MKNLICSAFIAFAVMFSFSAVAAQPSYDNVTVSYVSQDLKVNKGDGFGVGFSSTLTDSMFLSGSFTRADSSIAEADVYRLGLGVRGDFSNGASAYGQAYALRANLDYDHWVPGLRDFSSYGYGFEGGARVMLAPAFEIRGGAATERLTSRGSWTTYGLVGATFNITDRVALVADARLHNNANQYTAGVQFQF